MSDIELTEEQANRLTDFIVTFKGKTLKQETINSWIRADLIKIKKSALEEVRELMANIEQGHSHYEQDIAIRISGLYEQVVSGLQNKIKELEEK